ncbi:hypothetical protein RRG08_060183 [Elysia crispata]|uniref:Uncharacterized protein n=1 Tax=Elysia crispata TaxID=231223 RepID=A0AAE1A123_9GAST|nr:hypothetical protein RRG08_060183 [Elysia crispata]
METPQQSRQVRAEGRLTSAFPRFLMIRLRICQEPSRIMLRIDLNPELSYPKQIPNFKDYELICGMALRGSDSASWLLGSRVVGCQDNPDNKPETRTFDTPCSYHIINNPKENREGRREGKNKYSGYIASLS